MVKQLGSSEYGLYFLYFTFYHHMRSLSSDELPLRTVVDVQRVIFAASARKKTFSLSNDIL